MQFPKKILDALASTGNFIKSIFSRKSGFISIRTKLVSEFMVIIIPIIILGFFSFNKASTAIKDNASESNKQTIIQGSNYFELFFTNIADLSMQVFVNNDVKTYLSTTFTDENIYDRLQLQTKASDFINNLTVSNKAISDVLLLSNNKLSMGTSSYSLYDVNLDTYKEGPLYKKVSENDGKPVWVGAHDDIDELRTSKTKNYALSMARIVKNLGSAKDASLLVFDIKKSEVEKLLGGINLGKGSQIHLIAPDLTDITVSSETDADESNSQSITAQTFFDNIVKGESDDGSEIVEYDGINCLVSYSKTDSGFILIGTVPVSSLVSSAESIKWFTIIFVIVFAIIASLWGIYIASGMGRTINRIIKTAGQAASGDLTVSPVSKRKDELGILTKSISKMIASMRQLIEQSIEIAGRVGESSSTVSTTSQQVSAVSHEISRAIQEISNGATSQASDAEQGVNKITQLASKINNVSQNAKLIDNVCKTTIDLTQHGLTSIEELDKKAQETTSITKLILTDIQSLDLHSKSIGKIIKVISGIADQTNLLALNATIEAARAGEMGKGFAVVADEVRKLAEQSMSAAREISSIIGNTQQQTTQTVDRAMSAEEILKSQNEAVSEAIRIFREISASMDTLAEKVSYIISGVDEMEQDKEHAILAIQNISAVSEETAASSQEVTASTEEQLSSIEELAAFAEELNNTSIKLSESISRFKID